MNKVEFCLKVVVLLVSFELIEWYVKVVHTFPKGY